MIETKVAVCGLFCGNCRKYQTDRCKGCAVQAGLAGCRIRTCAFERGFTTCAECEEMETCKTLDNFIGKIFSFIFRSDRMGGLRMIRDEGMEAFIQYKTAQGKM
jgi:hypothetical protein